jgi:hypothetical protein
MTTSVVLPSIPTPLRWGLPPVSGGIGGDGALAITAGPRTDMFVNPAGTDVVLNAPRLVFASAGDFMLSARDAGIHHQKDRDADTSGNADSCTSDSWSGWWHSLTSNILHHLRAALAAPRRAMPWLKDRKDGSNPQHKEGNNRGKQQHGWERPKAGAHSICTNSGC